MPIAFSFHEDEETLSRREETLDLLRKTTVDVGLTSKASGRSKFLMAIHAHGAPVMRIFGTRGRFYCLAFHALFLQKGRVRRTRR